ALEPAHPAWDRVDGSELVEDLVDPEALEAAKRLVEAFEGAIVEPADLVDRLEMAVVELVDHLGDLFPLGRQADADRTAVGAAALLEDVAGLDQLLEVVRDVRPQIVTAGAQLAGGHFGVADVEHQQRLDGVDV